MKRSSLCGIFLDSVMLLPKFSSSGVAYGAISEYVIDSASWYTRK